MISLEKYRAWLNEYDCDAVRAWCPEVSRRRHQAAMAELARRSTDDEDSRRYAAACPIAGVDHTQYRLRELMLPSGVSVLAGVHFRGLAKEYPFVGVFAQSRWLTIDEVPEAHRALMREFSAFAPRASWWWLPAGRDLGSLAATTPDQYLVMGSLEEIRRLSAPQLPAQWRLRRVEAASEIETAFTELYRAFHAARPDLADVVGITAAEALEECARAGGLYACFEGTELVGMVAVKPDDRYCVDAWLMWDIVLARKYCGQGLAAALQRAVLDRLDTIRAPLVVGTINAKNLPSLGTALRCGRQVVGAWVFVEDASPVTGCILEPALPEHALGEAGILELGADKIAVGELRAVEGCAAQIAPVEDEEIASQMVELLTFQGLAREAEVRDGGVGLHGRAQRLKTVFRS